MKIFVICSVRGASQEYRDRLEKYVSGLEGQGVSVHLPHGDTNQQASGFNICAENASAILASDEVHVFYSPSSQGTHFDMGVAFAHHKKIRVIENGTVEAGKCYPRMLLEWEAAG
jgi:predicted dehydrogenase